MVTVRNLTPEDAASLTALYAAYEWWDDREVADVRAALAEAEVAVGVDVDGELDAAARVLTDYRYYATLFDVVVAEAHRDAGGGERLLRAVTDHPDLQSVAGASLLCRRGLVPFYESAGFGQFDPEVDVPEGDTVALVRMTDEMPEQGRS